MKTDPYYPRILIVNAYFTEQSGSGTFLGRLFSNWPVDRIATVCEGTLIPDWNKCRLHFRTGELRLLLSNIIERFVPAMRTGPVLPSSTISDPGAVVLSHTVFPKVPFVHRLARLPWRLLLRYFSDGETLYCVGPSQELLSWIQDFQPEVIYGHCSGLNSVLLLRRLQQELSLPLVLHFMDDWAETCYRQGWVKQLFRARFDTEFRQLVRSADVTVAICQEMANEYQTRYQRSVLSLPMPVELDAYSFTTRNEWTGGSPFRLRYGGRVGWAISDSLVDIAESIHYLRQNGADVEFDLVTFQTEEVPATCFALPGVNVQIPGPLADLPRIQGEADVLVICYDFDIESIHQAQYSMPSKLADCLASGTPILVYGPAGLPVVEYARRECWGKVVDNRDKTVLLAAVCELMDSASLREQLGRTAKGLADKWHDTKTVSEKMRRILEEAASTKQS